MPKGKKTQKNNKNSQNSSTVQKRTLIFKEDMEEYAQVTKMLGDLRILIILPDKSEVMATIPGSFKKKRCFINIGDVLLVSKRLFQQSKYDVCYKYNKDEIRSLVEYLEIPEFFLEINDGTVKGDGHVDFEFVEEDINIDEI